MCKCGLNLLYNITYYTTHSDFCYIRLPHEVNANESRWASNTWIRFVYYGEWRNSERRTATTAKKERKTIREFFFSLVLPFSCSVCLHRKCEELSWALFNAHARIDVSEDIQNKNGERRGRAKAAEHTQILHRQKHLALYSNNVCAFMDACYNIVHGKRVLISHLTSFLVV